MTTLRYNGRNLPNPCPTQALIDTNHPIMGNLFSSSFNPVTDIPGLNDKVVMVTGGK